MVHVAKCLGGPKHGELVATPSQSFRVSRPNPNVLKWNGEIRTSEVIGIDTGTYVYNIETWGEPVWHWCGWDSA